MRALRAVGAIAVVLAGACTGTSGVRSDPSHGLSSKGPQLSIEYAIADSLPPWDSGEWAPLDYEVAFDRGTTLWLRTGTPTQRASGTWKLHGPVSLESNFVLEVSEGDEVVFVDSTALGWALATGSGDVGASWTPFVGGANKRSSAPDACCRFIKDIVREAGKAGKNIARETGVAVHNSGKAIGKAGEDVWRESGVGAHNVVKATGKAAEDALDALGEGMDEWANDSTQSGTRPNTNPAASTSVIYAADSMTGECTQTRLYYAVDGKIYSADSQSGARTNRVLRHIVRGVVYAADSLTGDRTDRVLWHILDGVVYAADSATGRRTDRRLRYIEGGRVYSADAITGARTSRVLRCVRGSELTD